MASVTALNMVNRVRLFRRQPETTVIATPEDTVTLNAINMAIGDILGARKWESDLRHDGQITLRARLDGLTVTSSADSSRMNVIRTAGLVDADVFGDYAVSLLIDGDTDYGNTPLRVERSTAVTSGTDAILRLKTELPDAIEFLEDGVTLVDAELHYGEYFLPDTVREVVRISYGEEEVTLWQADPVLRYDELFPNPSERLGPPETVAVGGFDIATYETLVDETGLVDPALRMAVYPIPDDEYILKYSYYYRHPELVAATDTLVGVPPNVVSDIVFQATATVAMTWDQNYAADHFRDIAQQQTAQKLRSYGGSTARRRPIVSFENGGARVRVERGFPGRTIG